MSNDNIFSAAGTVIPATRSDEEFLHAIGCAPEVIFDLNPDLMNVSAKLKKAHDAGKKLFIHLDLAKGIGKDESGIRFLKRIGIDGVITTKVSITKMARECGICTVQRFFIVDSHSIATTVEAVKSSKPDMIEIMPGTVIKIIERLKKMIDIPIIAGGLIENGEEICAALENGAAAVSTGRRELWV
ncbi:MAG: glycerol-3-phosphate responsive antiterminator [Clostridia bacterium]|nr:glycerol-3-phosphate responsive antiterminator [Clostridia bacterium]